MNKNKTLEEQENKKTYQERNTIQEEEQKLDNCECCKEWQRGYFGYASYIAGKRRQNKFLWY